MGASAGRATRLRRVAILCAALSALSLGGLWLGLDLAATWAAERAGKAALGVPVRVARAHVSLWEGELVLLGLEVANPPGFGNEPVLSLERLSMRVSRQALGGSPLVIDALEAQGALVQVQAAAGQTNLEALCRRAQAFADEHQGEHPRRMVVRRLSVRGSRASAQLPIPGRPRATVPVKDIELRDVGREQGGLTPSQAVQLVARLLEPGARNALRSTDLLKLGGDGGRSAGRKLRDLFR